MKQATTSDIPAIVEILTPPFLTNKSVNHCVKQDKKRIQRIENQIRYIARLSVRNHMAFINSTQTGAVLCTLSNGKKATLFDDIFFIRKVSGLKLGLKLMKRENLLKKIYPKNNFCHLIYIGVSPNLQGKGQGSEMMKTIKEKCQSLNLPILLETSNPLNLDFYSKNGFELYSEEKLPTDDFKLYFFMLKPGSC